MSLKIIDKKPPKYPFLFSICTIVSDMDEYHVMKDSFLTNGFEEENCEYIIADNTHKNEFDAYQAISSFLKISTGEYLIIAHQDVRIIDNKQKLISCLEELNKIDPNWAICGNSGGLGYHQTILHITHINETFIPKENLPHPIKSLDENFLVIKKSTNLTISPNLKGFHLYGTDLCIIAKFLGYSSYVIPFMLLHLSEGNIKSLELYKNEFIQQYGEKMKLGFLQTTCTRFYLSNSKIKNRIFNSKFCFFIIKQLVRYPYLIKYKTKIFG